MRTKLLILLLAGFLVACDGDDVDNQARAEFEQLPLYMLSVDGVGPLNAETPFNLVRIGEAFQNLDVAQETYFIEGKKQPVITVKQRIKHLLSINPDFRQEGIFSVVVHDNLIGNRLGHRIGKRFADIYADKTEKCASAMEDWAGKVICYAPRTNNVLYLFSGSGDVDSIKDAKVPPLEELADWELESIVWKPPVL